MHSTSSPTYTASKDNADYILFSCGFINIEDWLSSDEVGFFNLNFALRQELINQGFVKNHDRSDRGSYLEYNLINCIKPIKSALVKEYDDDELHVESMRCQSRHCFHCADARARREVQSMVSYLSAIVQRFNCETAYHIVFSLPEGLAASLYKQEKLEKDARDKMRDLIHKFMLSRKNVKKMNIPLHESRHIVSSKSLMKIRMHYHYIAVCGICVTTINKDSNEYIISTDTLSGAIPQSAFDEINERWHKFLQKINKKKLTRSSRVYVVECPLTGNNEDKEDILRSLLNYTTKAFGKEFLEAPCFINSSEDELIIPAGKDKEGQKLFQVVSIKEFIRQWNFVRENRKVACAGLLYSKERFGKVLGIEFVQKEMTAELIDIDDAEIVTTHQRTKDGNLKTKKDVFLKPPEGKPVHLPPENINIGMRGKIKYWAPTPTQ